ncbi:uncharacterized protein [Branchiostoma lanceolatum]|uniref:uncharacterized protein n=1 Tax=Branchiostoma lanceolatum TaxID=7740 RepID=UPI003452B8FA
MTKTSPDGKIDATPATATTKSTSAASKAVATPGGSFVSDRHTPPPPCTGMTCENGGILMKKTCRCRCTENYYGALCQKSRAEVRFGVIINIRMVASQWHKAKRLLKKAVSRVINKYCAVRFSLCCPYSQEKKSHAQLEFVTEDDIHVGAGYPEVIPPLLKVMLLATPRENNEMCADETLVNSRARRDLTSPAIALEPPISTHHSIDVGFDNETRLFLDQSTLILALEEHRGEIEDVIGAPIEGVERATVEEGQDGEKTADLAVIFGVLGVTMLLVSIVGVVLAKHRRTRKRCCAEVRPSQVPT